MHLRIHAFDDIMAKGVTCNYNMKINENLHGPIKDFYEQIGNGKDVDRNVCQLEHLICFCMIIELISLKNLIDNAY